MVRIQNRRSESFRHKKGVREGCFISSLLFNAVGEKIMRKVEKELTGGAGSGWMEIYLEYHYIRHADDSNLIANTKKELKHDWTP